MKFTATILLIAAATLASADLAVIRDGTFTGTFYSEDLQAYRAFHAGQGEVCIWMDTRPEIVGMTRPKHGRPVYRLPTSAELAATAPRPAAFPAGIEVGGRGIVTGDLLLTDPSRGVMQTDTNGIIWTQYPDGDGGGLWVQSSGSPEHDLPTRLAERARKQALRTNNVASVAGVMANALQARDRATNALSTVSGFDRTQWTGTQRTEIRKLEDALAESLRAERDLSQAVRELSRVVFGRQAP